MRGTIRRLVLAGALMAAMVACDDDGGLDAQQGATREEVAQHGEDLIGRTVTIAGVVNEPQNASAIEIAGEGTFFDGAPVLIVGRNLPPTAAGARIEVTGTVRPFDLAELEREIGAELSFEPDAYDIAVIASEVRSIEPSGTFDRQPS